ncbi:MAG: hypothetical protein H0W53_23295 [Acidobacteria bacterium]|nr:hypothetical protein [Acidobacteriota bacterium]
MAAEASGNGGASGAGGTRPWHVVLLVVLTGILLWMIFPGGAASPSVTNTANPRAAGAKPGEQQVQPSDLDVKIEALGEEPAPLGAAGRNPFRFQPKPPPPPPPAPPAQKPVAVAPPPPTQPTGPPAIGTLVKFIGIVDTGKEKVGAFSDCRTTFSGREGEIMEGRFRLLRIGVESAVVEYADGQGRTTLPLNGQACVGK